MLSGDSQSSLFIPVSCWSSLLILFRYIRRFCVLLHSFKIPWGTLQPQKNSQRMPCLDNTSETSVGVVLRLLRCVAWHWNGLEDWKTFPVIRTIHGRSTAVNTRFHHPELFQSQVGRIPTIMDPNNGLMFPKAYNPQSLFLIRVEHRCDCTPGWIKLK